MLRQELSRAVSALRTATVGMHEASRCGPTLPDRHRSRLVHHLCPQMGGHGPSDHGTRAQRQDDGERQPAFARRQRGNVSNRHGSWCLHCPLPIELVRGHGLGLPRSKGRLEPAPCLAAQPCVGQPTPTTTAADVSPLLSSQVLEPARTVRAPPLGNIVLSFALHGLLSFPWGAGRAAEPRVIPTPRDLQELTQTTARALGGLLGPPRVLDSSCGAKDAAAFLKLSRSSCTRTCSFRRRLRSS